MRDWIDRASWLLVGLLIAPWLWPILLQPLPGGTKLRLFLEFIRYWRNFE